MALDPARVRMWNAFSAKSSPYGKEMKDHTKTLEDATIIDGQRVVFEVQLEDGTWPFKANSNGTNANGNSNGNGTSGTQKLLGGAVAMLKKLNIMMGWTGNGEVGTSVDGERVKDSSSSWGNYPKGVCGLYNLGIYLFIFTLNSSNFSFREYLLYEFCLTGTICSVILQMFFF